MKSFSRDTKNDDHMWERRKQYLEEINSLVKVIQIEKRGANSCTWDHFLWKFLELRDSKVTVIPTAPTAQPTLSLLPSRNSVPGLVEVLRGKKPQRDYVTCPRSHVVTGGIWIALLLWTSPDHSIYLILPQNHNELFRKDKRPPSLLWEWKHQNRRTQLPNFLLPGDLSGARLLSVLFPLLSWRRQRLWKWRSQYPFCLWICIKCLQGKANASTLCLQTISGLYCEFILFSVDLGNLFRILKQGSFSIKVWSGSWGKKLLSLCLHPLPIS